MPTIHKEYSGHAWLGLAAVSPHTLRADMVGGEFLGDGVLPEMWEDGDIIACTEDGYWFDPELLIDGDHYARVKKDGHYVVDENRNVRLRFWLKLKEA